jgi:hypothetical protein
MFLAVGLLLATVLVQAQETKSTTRLQRQHKYTEFQKKQMKQTEASILAGIQGESVGMQQGAIQALRELAQIAGDYPFSSLIIPLEGKLTNTQSDRTVRMLAALALDELHSDAGDAVIKSVAEKSEDEGLQALCKALLVRSELK